jgi:ornithine cyclodeaminase/alanine dehydrogenase
MMATLAAADDPPFLAVKALVLNPITRYGFESINALVTLLDSRWIAAAIIDGNWVTAVQTAGLSAVAAKLARRDASIAAFMVVVLQRTVIAGLAAMFPLFKRLVVEPPARCILSQRGKHGADGYCQSNAQEAVSDADLIVTQ